MFFEGHNDFSMERRSGYPREVAFTKQRELMGGLVRWDTFGQPYTTNAEV